MFLRPLRHSSTRWTIGRTLSYAARAHNSTASFPTIQSCPSPTCGCAEMPSMPEGLEINYEKPLNGTMAGYAEQVLVCTGQADWKSRIEEEKDGDNLVADLKELLIKGEYSDPYNNVLVTNSSFPPSVPSRQQIENQSAYLLPSFKYVPFLPRVSFDSVRALVKGYVQPEKLHPAHDKLSPIHRDRLTRKTEFRSALPGVQDVEDFLVLICGHGGRDMRCGIMGPLLESEFEKVLPKFGIQVAKGPVRISSENEKTIEGSTKEGTTSARIGLISHIGGHAYAGNVICYIPPTAKAKDGSRHPLAGSGIWYGRIEPKHVEGVIKETLKNGRVIADHFRGGIKQGGDILRL